MTLIEILPAIHQLSVPDKLRLIRLLAEDLDRAEDISPFEHHKLYYLLTPYNSFGAAEVLARALSASDDDGA